MPRKVKHMHGFMSMEIVCCENGTVFREPYSWIEIFEPREKDNVLGLNSRTYPVKTKIIGVTVFIIHQIFSLKARRMETESARGIWIF